MREFACKDGSDKVLIDSNLVSILQNIRSHFGAAVKINSGYRTASHNKAVGGATNSNHMKGIAADIVVSGVDETKVAQYAESIGVKGIGLYTKKNFTHVDTRTSKSFWKNTGSDDKPVSTHGGYTEPTTTLRVGSKGDGVRWVQQKLKITVDGSFGPKTETAVRTFQRRNSLVADGVVGAKTKGALQKE